MQNLTDHKVFAAFVLVVHNYHTNRHAIDQRIPASVKPLFLLQVLLFISYLRINSLVALQTIVFHPIFSLYLLSYWLSMEGSINKSINHSLSHSLTHIFIRSLIHSLTHSLNQYISQSINQSIN